MIDWRPAPQALPWQPPAGGGGSEWSHSREPVSWQQPGDGGGEWGHCHKAPWPESSGEWRSQEPSVEAVASPKEREGSAGRYTIYTARSVRLAMDSEGFTGLELRWDE